MERLRAAVVIAAPAERVWEIVGRRFADMGDWATAVLSSSAIDRPAEVDAPVAGRACRTGVPFVPEVTERIVAYDEANRTLTYVADDAPLFFGGARNTWHVRAVDDDHAEVTVDATVDPGGVLSRIVFAVARRRLDRLSAETLDDLRHYAETGEPSPRKRRRRRTSTATPTG